MAALYRKLWHTDALQFAAQQNMYQCFLLYSVYTYMYFNIGTM